mmetsp:Transcript_29014/g.33340  ORF Transcript_29014/g.33340 Transcript_29014/m.33340 type:complete len:515 (-) Transcript_29014:117-1661(-)
MYSITNKRVPLTALFISSILFATNAKETFALSNSFIDFCALSANKVQFDFDQEKETFLIVSEKGNDDKVNSDSESGDGSERRNLMMRGTRSSNSSLNTVSSSSSSNLNRNLNQDIIYGRECKCGSVHRESKTYCIIKNNENWCRVPNSKSDSVECYQHNTSQIFIRNTWPLTLLWLLAMVIYLVVTEAGRNLLRYVLHKICRCQCMDNRRLVEDILEREAATRNLLQGSSFVRSNHCNTNVTYILKTKSYKSEDTSERKKNGSYGLDSSPSNQTLATTPDTKSSSFSFDDSARHYNDTDESNSPSPNSSAEDIEICSPCSTVRSNNDTNHEGDEDDEFDDDEVMCTICMIEIEDGDRIGALPCNHPFHVDCLKEWIKRRNVCPLCQSPDIAEERNQNPPTAEQAATPSPQSQSFVVRTTGSPVDLGTQRRSRRWRQTVRASNSIGNENNNNLRRQLFHVNFEGRVARSSGGVTLVTSRSLNGSNGQRHILVGDPAATTVRRQPLTQYTLAERRT